MCIGNEYVGISFFLIILLVGISMVSVHYRKKYEELREFIKLKKELGEL